MFSRCNNESDVGPGNFHYRLDVVECSVDVTMKAMFQVYIHKKSNQNYTVICFLTQDPGGSDHAMSD